MNNCETWFTSSLALVAGTTFIFSTSNKLLIIRVLNRIIDNFHVSLLDQLLFIVSLLLHFVLPPFSLISTLLNYVILHSLFTFKKFQFLRHISMLRICIHLTHYGTLKIFSMIFQIHFLVSFMQSHQFVMLLLLLFHSSVLFFVFLALIKC